MVNPNDIVAQYGADTMRLHIMFIGDFEKAVTWSNEAVKGSKRFLDRCWNLMDLAQDSDELSQKNEALIHKTIKKVTADIDDLKMNTAIAALMAMVNEFYSSGLTRGDLQQLMLLLSPFAPHMVEEMWELTGYAGKTGRMAMPIIGTVASTWALFRCKGLTVRCVMWCSTACWVTHNLWLGSIGGTLIEGSFLIVNGLNIIRFRRMQKRGIDPFRVENAVQEESPSAR